ncbi:MopE-related protein [Saprospiraceae bacterium]|nr:MopE-related protein [Saprospiraceae bacterium]
MLNLTNFKQYKFVCIFFLLCFSLSIQAQITNADRSGFTWINTENVSDESFGSGYTLYSAAWPTYNKYPGSSGYQMGLAGGWLTTQRTGTEPADFYTTIEGGLGWWGDTRFGKETPKFIMGGVSFNFYAWANGTGAGRSNNLPSGQRDWSTPGGKYGVAQLSNRLLWAPDGLNVAQCLNGELLGYGYTPLPLTDPLTETDGVDIETGNQCWTLMLNTTNFKGPATFFMPTFWTKPVLEDTSLEGLFFDSRPSDPNMGLGLEHADTPAIVSKDSNDDTYAKTAGMQFPISGEDNSILMHGMTVYSQSALWNDMVSWFDGGPAVDPSFNVNGTNGVPFINNGGFMVGEFSAQGPDPFEHEIDLSFMNPTQMNSNTMGYSFDVNQIKKTENNFVLPEYYKLEENEWRAINVMDVPPSTNLVDTPVPTTPRTEIPYLTPMEPDCAWQDPNGPWESPGPSAGPFTADLGDGSTVTYYWYRFVDQPAIIHANLPAEVREKMQERIELIHGNWNHTDEYTAPPEVGNLATLDPEIIVEPPAGFEVGYVPIVTRQEKTESKLRVFILAGQSNMEGHGTIIDPENDPGSLVDVIAKDEDGKWSNIGEVENWETLENTYVYFPRFDGDTIRTNATVGQGSNSNLIGPELMFAHQLDAYYDDPVLIIKTAWGGKSLAEDFRPPSAEGITGAFYTTMIETVNAVTGNLSAEFPVIAEEEYEISGFAWFQGWNDGASDAFLNEYESNLNHLVNDVRLDLGIPDLPFVIASSGHGGYSASTDGWVNTMQEIVSVAQEDVGCDDEMYGGRVGFVDTKQFYVEQNDSPQDAIHHFNNNAETYLNIGKSLGIEMISAINDKAYCYEDCGEDLILSELVSIGNRVWNDCNKDGVNDPFEPGIPGVSVLIWGDSNGDDIPDSQGFGGVRVTDEEGYYRFEGLQPGNYVVFVWQVDNWGDGEPLQGFLSSDVFEENADNDIDLDNNGSGNAFTDIFSGIVTLTIDGEPLNDGDPEDCIFDFDSGGNNTIDFGFYDPNAMDVDQDGFPDSADCDDMNPDVNPGQDEIPYNGIDDDCNEETLDDDLDQDGFALAEDCDDTNPDVNPDAEEIADNGIDDNCDGIELITAVHELGETTIRIYPNPAIDIVNVAVEHDLQFSMTLYDLDGKLLIRELNSIQVDVSSLNAGMYIIEIQDLLTKEKVIEKVVIMK